MKPARLITLIGAIVLAGSAAFHASGYSRFLLPLIAKDAIAWPTSGVLKASWLTFSVVLLAMAIIAALARNMERGGGIVLVCAAANAVCVVLMWHFLGFFAGVKLLSAVTILLAIGGSMQVWAGKTA